MERRAKRNKLIRKVHLHLRNHLQSERQKLLLPLLVLKGESNLLASTNAPLQAKAKFWILKHNQMFAMRKDHMFITRRENLLEITGLLLILM